MVLLCLFVLSLCVCHNLYADDEKNHLIVHRLGEYSDLDVYGLHKSIILSATLNT
jgi:hypothetical protein